MAIGNCDVIFIRNVTSFQHISFIQRECDACHLRFPPKKGGKHVFIICSSSKDFSIDFSSSWKSIFVSNSSTTVNPALAISSTSSLASLSSLMKAHSWTDIINEEVDVFKIIDVHLGTLGCVTKLHYPELDMTKRSMDAVYWLLNKNETKAALDKLVCSQLILMIY